MDPFMGRAVQLARENVKNGGQPFGAVLVKDGEIIAEGVNELHLHYDSSGHAELLAIRKAQKQLETLDLKDCTIYASGEPCPMCLTAMYFSGIQNAYYCESVEEAKTRGLEMSSFIYKEMTLPKEKRSLKMKQMPIDKRESPLILWASLKK